MANKKTNRTKATNKKVTEPVIETEKTVATTEVEPIVEKAELKVAEYEVVLAKSTYFIINKNGINVTIKKINNYKKGDIVTL